MKFLIISGLSGAGKSKFASTLEDLGYYCVDNMPVDFIPQFASICLATKGRYERVALVTDVRGGQSFDGLFKALTALDQMELQYRIVFVEASEEVIIKRYKETRRKHPLSAGGANLLDAVRRERELLQPVRDRADDIVDTSALSTSKLRGQIIKNFASDMQERAMSVSVVSFGYKYGIPIEADLVFDVRFLPNPYYMPELKDLSGLDPAVQEFVTSFTQTHDFLEKLRDMLTFLLPLYMEEGKTSLVIAIGCTGGRHRSVTIAQELGQFVKGLNYDVSISHRDLNRG